MTSPMCYGAMAEALQDIPPPPCETIGPDESKCPLYKTCATKHLACLRFFFYIHESAEDPADDMLNRYPTRELYGRTYDHVFRASPYPVRELDTLEKKAIRSETGTDTGVALQYRCTKQQVAALRRPRAADDGRRFGAAVSGTEDNPSLGSIGKTASVPDRERTAL